MANTTKGGVQRLENLVLNGVTVDSLTTTGAITGGAVTASTLNVLARGTFVCNQATPVVVADTNITANSVVIACLKTVGGTVGAIPAVKTITPTTGFTIAGTASDTSTYNYVIIG